MNQIATIESSDLTVAFGSDGGIESILSAIEKDVEAEAPDTSTTKGRKAIASLAHKVARSKTALDAAGKALNDDKRAAIEAVDAQRRIIRERLDALKARVRKPLDDWEDAEKERIDTHERNMAAFAWHDGYRDATSDQLGQAIDAIERITVDDAWEEFEADAAERKENCLNSLRAAYDVAKRHEEQAAEIARLKAQEAERIAKEEAERAEAERLERDRREAEDAERHRIEQEEADRQEAERRERERQEAANKAAEEERANAERLAAEREAQHKRDLAEANARAEAAAQAERQRIAAAAQAEREAEEERRRDTEHRTRILAEISTALQPIPREDIAAALMDGRIPHVEVKL